MDCPNCKEECWREDANIGVGVIYGPYGCPCCGWSEDKRKVYELEYGCPDMKESVTLFKISEVEQWVGGVLDNYNDKEFHFIVKVKFMTDDEIEQIPELD